MQCKINGYELVGFNFSNPNELEATIILLVDEQEVDKVTIRLDNWFDTALYEQLTSPVNDAIRKALFVAEIVHDNQPLLFGGE